MSAEKWTSVRLCCWEALKLAKQVDPSQLGVISREWAALLEMRGEFDVALEAFNRAVQYGGQDAADLEKSRAGIARCTIQCGDVRRGKQMAWSLTLVPLTA